VSHRLRARPAPPASPPPIVTDPDVVASFLSDAAHVAGGRADGVAFPRSEAEVASLVAGAARVLPVGAQSSLTGGATPRGEVVISTRALTRIGVPSDGSVAVGAGVALADLQRALRSDGLYYPPAPTFDGAFVGGTVATNAAGAATFKYGSTRRWVSAITAVLASGDVLDIRRGETTADDKGRFEIILASGDTRLINVPTYTMPEVPKLSAGYHARPGMDLIDLFIGSEGTLGIITSVALRVIPRPRHAMALVRCASDAHAIAVTSALRAEARMAWEGRSPLDVSAIEYVDRRASSVVPDAMWARAGAERPQTGGALLLVQIEAADALDDGLARLAAILDAHGPADPIVASPDDARGSANLLALREAVPASVNALVAEARTVDPRIEKTAGDMIVPLERLGDSLALYRRAFDRRGLDHAVWGHVSDGNLHPNVVPRTFDDVERGREALLEIAREVTAMGGAPLAEHGVGRSALKQRMLRELYGSAGIEQMRAVKRALDPAGKLAPGVIFR
jgi:D-lactate dehydrogenase (cytochrome)